MPGIESVNNLFSPIASASRFILWRRADKIPADASGNPIDATRPGNCRSLAALLPYVNHTYGLGLVLTDDSDLWCIDIDDAFDPSGALTPFAAGTVAAFPGAYMEVSQSGQGIHVIGSGARALPPDHPTRSAGMPAELYTRRRYIALTGDRAAGSPVMECGAALAAWSAAHLPAARQELADLPGPVCGGMDGLPAAMLMSRGGLRQAFGAGLHVRDLWEARAEALAAAFPAQGPRDDGLAYDASAADQALCNHLAFWTGRNAAAMDALWLSSPLGVRSKTQQREDYRRRTIARSLADVTSVRTASDGEAVPERPSRPSRPYITFVDFNGTGAPSIKSQNNIKAMLHAYGITLSYDSFADCCYANTDIITDIIVTTWWGILDSAGMKCSKTYLDDVVLYLAHENTYNPVLDYLNRLKWDGVPRVDKWLHTYLGAADTEINRAYGRCHLLAAVHRAYTPGCKYDQMLVLHGDQGTGKSSAISTLCPEDTWFTDNLEIGEQSREMIEGTSGKWIVEMAELAGMRRAADWETVKAYLSRTVDQARLAYGRRPVRRPRAFVIFGTVNHTDYLDNASGSRRFWTADTGVIDLDALRRDRDQLWAECVHRKSESIVLPSHLWAVSAADTESRLTMDVWEEKLSSSWLPEDNFTWVKSDDIYKYLDIDTSRRGNLMRLNRIMQKLGFRRIQQQISNVRAWGWRKI